MDFTYIIDTPVVTPTTTHGEKLEKFTQLDFQRWQQKMFYLTTLNLAKVLHEDAPTLNEGETNKQIVAVVEAWKHSNFLCKNYILNGLNTMYNVYSQVKTTKELWESLAKKYKIEDAGMKKFIVGKFLDYKIVDSKTVTNQAKSFK